MPGSCLNIADHIHWIFQSINMAVSLSHNHKIEKRKSIVFFRQLEGIDFLNCTLKCPVTEIGQSKLLFLLTVAQLCFQAKKLPFSHGNGHSEWLTEWLFLYNYRIICRLANTKDLRFSTQWCIIILCNVANSSLDHSLVHYQWSGMIKLLQFTIVRFF